MSERKRANVPPAGNEAYRRAGVDLQAAAEAVELIRALARDASRPEVAEGVGGFAGLFRIGEGRSLAAATDGVGTKLEVARLCARFDTIGIDLVAMCADDVVCTGAEPLFFLDYLAVDRVVPEEVAEIVGGVAEGCRRAGCALIGGETAEHPAVKRSGEVDLAGFCVGVVQDDAMLGPHRVREDDVLVGLASSGLHSNGYSLIRQAFFQEAAYELDDVLPRLGRSLADELLEPTAIYTPLMLALVRDRLVHAAAHITGGGLVENVPRALPEGLGAEIRSGSWPAPPVFELIREVIAVDEEALRSTFNLGIGMVLVVSPRDVPAVLSRAGVVGTRAFEIGRVTRGERRVVFA